MMLLSPALSLADEVSSALASLAGASPAPVQHFTLDNGLSVYFREQKRTTLAAIQLWYNVGTSHEPRGQTSLSHLLEHLIFQGSGKLASGQYGKVISRLAGKNNGYTHLDATSFDIVLPTSRLPIALELMADAMDSASFGRLEREQGVKAVAHERRLKLEGEPLQQVYDDHLALAHGSSPYGAPTFGTAADVDNVDLQTLRQWYRTWYHPNNATLVVVGNLDLPTLRQHVETYFSHKKRALIPDSPDVRHDLDLKERSQTVSLPGVSHGLFMSFNVPSCATAIDPLTSKTLELICEVLAQGPGSRLYAELVRDRAVLTGVAASYEPLVRGDTLLTLSAYVNTFQATPEQAAEAIYQEIEWLHTQEISADNLQRIKLQMLARQLFSLDDIALQAAQIGAAAAAGQSASLIDQHATLIAAIDGAQVQQVARTYLSRDRLTITYLLPGDQA